MLRVTIDINGEIIHQSAYYNTLKTDKNNKTIYRNVVDARKRLSHRRLPIPMGGLKLGIEILEKDLKEEWKSFHKRTKDAST